MLDFQVARNGTIDDGIKGVNAPDHTAFAAEHDQTLFIGFAQHVALNAAIHAQTARKQHVTNDDDVVRNQAGELGDFNRVLPVFFAKHGGCAP